jgi:hypothetical protein
LKIAFVRFFVRRFSDRIGCCREGRDCQQHGRVVVPTRDRQLPTPHAKMQFKLRLTILKKPRPQ